MLVVMSGAVHRSLSAVQCGDVPESALTLIQSERDWNVRACKISANLLHGNGQVMADQPSYILWAGCDADLRLQVASEDIAGATHMPCEGPI